MFMTRLKMAAAVLAACVALTGSGLLVQQVLAAKPADTKAKGAPKATHQGADQSTKPIPPEKFQILHALIKPQGDERKWREVPWETSLIEARKKAAAEGKPLGIAVLNSLPFGMC